MPRLYLVLLIVLCAFIQSPPVFAAETGDGRSVLLIAGEDMADPRFRQSVVLVTRHGRSNSTVGVIVNRPLGAGLGRIFPQLKQAAQHRLYYGGPVGQGQLVFMLRGETGPATALVVAERLFLGNDGDSLRTLIEAPTPASRLRVFSGFASWAPYQLESEIGRGDWYLLPVDVDALFNDPPDGMWLRLWRRATQLMVLTPALQREYLAGSALTPSPAENCRAPQGNWANRTTSRPRLPPYCRPPSYPQDPS